MQLSSLLKNVEIDGDLEPRDLEITGIAYDSRRVRVGELFVALAGTKTNGNRFIEQSKARGAAAILSEAPAPEGFAKPWSQVKNARKALAVVSSNFFGNPTESLRLIGITGTNGKTSTAYLIESILKASRKRVGL